MSENSTGLASPPRSLYDTFSGVCHGTIGELYQGPIVIDGKLEIAVVSLPVDKFSWSYFRPTDEKVPSLASGKTKVQSAIQQFCRLLDVDPPIGQWSFFSEIPVGQGMASSTADIVATVRCLFNIYGHTFSEPIAREILGGIERSDSVFLDEFAVYLSARQEVARPLGKNLDFHVCYGMESGLVKTEEFTEQLLSFYRERQSSYAQVLDTLQTGFEQGNRAEVARASTRSAQLSQLLLPKKNFEELAENQTYFDADGIVVAHTGTVQGYLFSQRPTRIQMDELSVFFRTLGMQCSFARGGNWNV